MGRKVGIIAYGEEEDRRKVEVLARLEHKSVSQWIISRIRERHAELFSPLEPIGFSNKGDSDRDRLG